MTASFWTHRRVLVTGGAGFVGAQVVERLRVEGCHDVAVPRKEESDLRQDTDLTRVFETVRSHIVIHLAGVVGGIEANRQHPGRFFYENALMGIRLIEQARVHQVEKFVCIGTVCSYPKLAPIPFKEDQLWDGYPEETNAPYGVAKKMLFVQLRAYQQEYGFKSIGLIPVNLYGPGDSFDLERGHVIPALIRKCIEAQQQGRPAVSVWGSGRATREFLFVEDAVEAIVLATARLDHSDPLNLGSGEEIRIRDLAHLIKELVGYEGKLTWDRSRPDGQPRRRVDASRAQQALGWRPRIRLRTGLERTIKWFRAHREAATTDRASVDGARRTRA